MRTADAGARNASACAMSAKATKLTKTRAMPMELLVKRYAMYSVTQITLDRVTSHASPPPHRERLGGGGGGGGGGAELGGGGG
jgi:uncharacterized membrane protein